MNFRNEIVANSMIDIDHEFRLLSIEIKQKAQAVIAQINQRADEIIEDLRADHMGAMHHLDWVVEQRDIAAEIKARIHPYDSFEDWWDNLPEEDEDGLWSTHAGRSSWSELYQEFQYGVDSDRAISDDDHFSFAVMGFLRNRDTYLMQPFCCYCDSRGHENGGCMSDQHAQKRSFN